MCVKLLTGKIRLYEYVYTCGMTTRNSLVKYRELLRYEKDKQSEII